MIYYDFDELDEGCSKVMTAIVAVWVEKQHMAQELNMTDEEAVWSLCGLIETGFAQVYATKDPDGEFSFWIEIDEDSASLSKQTVH